MRLAVVVAHRNDSENLKYCVENLLLATSQEDSIYIIDDNSSREHKPQAQGTLADKRVNIVLKLKQHGPFVCKNIMIKKLLDKYEYISFQDSDDVCDKSRFDRQIAQLNNNSANVSFCKYVRVKSRGDLSSSGDGRDCIASMLFRTKDFNKIGYFYALKYGADAEMLERVKKSSDIKATFLQDVLYYAVEREGSLSNRGVSPTTGELLAEDRKQFQQAFLSEMQRGKLYKPKGIFELPAFSFPEEMSAIKLKKVAYMATFDKRSGALRQRAIKSISKQVDSLILYVNSGDTKDISALNIDNVEVLQNTSDMGDNSKLNAFFCRENAYIFTVDDDIELPELYVQDAIYAIETGLVRDCLYGHMGYKYLLDTSPKATFSNEKMDKDSTHFNDRQENYQVVDALGTGLMFFSSDVLAKVDPTLVKSILNIMPYGMCDELVMLIARCSGIKCITLPRKENSFKSQNTADSIFTRNKGTSSADSIKSTVALLSHVFGSKSDYSDSIECLTIGDIRRLLDADLYSKIVADIIF